MGKLTGDTKYWDDAVCQVLQLSARLFVPEKGLSAHGWSENAAPYSPRFYWGRANGWAIMAMAELLEVLPADYRGRAEVLHIFRTQMRALVELQDGSGLWYNLLDKPETYLETSASAMFVYGLAKGVNEGWLPASYAPAAIVGWNGVASKILPDGRVDGICEGTTYANDNAYYFHRGASANTTFLGSVLYAGAETIRLLRNPALAIAGSEKGSVNSAIHVRRTEDLKQVKQ
jgi:rhamnogalacturonyl hydrolase YesR